MDFVGNFIRFSVVQNFGNRLRFDKVAESLKVGTFLRHSVECAQLHSVLFRCRHSRRQSHGLLVVFVMCVYNLVVLCLTWAPAS